MGEEDTMKKHYMIGAVLICTAMLATTTAIAITRPYHTTTASAPEQQITPTPNGGGFLQRLKRVLTGQLTDTDIAITANIHPSKLNLSAWPTTTITQYMSVSTAAFQPQESGYDYKNNGAMLENRDGDSDYYVAALYLPCGATVTNISMRWSDTSAAYNGNLYLTKREIFGSPNTMATVQTSGSSGMGYSYSNVIESPVIDNQYTCYYLSLNLPDQNIKCYGVIIEYTIEQ